MIFREFSITAIAAGGFVWLAILLSGCQETAQSSYGSNTQIEVNESMPVVRETPAEYPPYKEDR